MDKPGTLTNIFKHNLWANQRHFEKSKELTDEQLAASIPGTFGTIKDTLRHIAAAEQSYLSRISTGKPFPRDDVPAPETIGEMLTVVKETGRGFIEWTPRVKAEDTVTLDWDGTPREVPKTTILTQVINHANEHRAQVMTILTQEGVDPPDLSGWAYIEEHVTPTAVE